MSKKIFVLSILFCILVCCANMNEHSCVDSDTLIFLNVTNTVDTCIVWTFPDALYSDLNIKCISERKFYEYIKKVINLDQVIVVSDKYYQALKVNQIISNVIIDSIYATCGIDGVKKYVSNAPIINIENNDEEAFLWAAYLLWKNGIHVSIDDADCEWYVYE